LQKANIFLNMKLVIAFTLALVACADAAGFDCKDKSPDCPQWRRNMGGNCKGQDYQYMLINCPKTCEMCDEAKEKWEKEEAEKAKNPTSEPADSKVVVLDGDSIDDFIEEKKDSGIILLEFFAPWCGHCQHVAPAYRDAASIMHTESTAGRIPQPVFFAKFDDSAQVNARYRAAEEGKWNFTSYPSMFVVGGKEDLTKPTEELGQFPGEFGEKKVKYWGGHETEEIVFHMTQLANGKNQTEARVAWHEVEMGTKPGLYKKGGRHESDQILDLDPDTFVETVLQDDAVWIVEYYSDKCPICNSLAPEYVKAATKAQAEVNKPGEPVKLRYGAVNSRVFHELAEPFGITSYPWVTSFYMGENIEHMAGMGGWETFYRWGLKHLADDYKEENAGKGDKTKVLPPPLPPKDEL